MKPGGKLEALVSKTATFLAREGLARIWKWPEPVFLQKRLIPCPTCGTQQEVLEGSHSAKTGFDFFGYTSNGRVVAIECKEGYQKPTIRIPEHQAMALKEVARVNGFAFLIWSRGPEERLFFASKIEPARWVDGHPVARKDGILDLAFLFTAAGSGFHGSATWPVAAGKNAARG
jgi:penicillin-binding protein-related factor A (putative recombinase)